MECAEGRGSMRLRCWTRVPRFVCEFLYDDDEDDGDDDDDDDACVLRVLLFVHNIT